MAAQTGGGRDHKAHGDGRRYLEAHGDGRAYLEAHGDGRARPLLLVAGVEQLDLGAELTLLHAAHPLDPDRHNNVQ